MRRGNTGPFVHCRHVRALCLPIVIPSFSSFFFSLSLFFSLSKERDEDRWIGGKIYSLLIRFSTNVQWVYVFQFSSDERKGLVYGRIFFILWRLSPFILFCFRRSFLCLPKRPAARICSVALSADVNQGDRCLYVIISLLFQCVSLEVSSSSITTTPMSKPYQKFIIKPIFFFIQRSYICKLFWKSVDGFMMLVR